MFYGCFYGKVDACANGVYQQALSPPLKGPGDEAIVACTASQCYNGCVCVVSFRCTVELMVVR